MKRLIVLVLVGCGGSGGSQHGSMTPGGDALHGGMFMPGGKDPVVHAPPTAIAATELLSTATRDVAIDEGGNVWAATPHFIALLPSNGPARQFDSSDGLAQGDASAEFLAVGAGHAGQAFVGSDGRWADVVDLKPGGGIDVHHLTITDPIHAAHITRAFRFAVDLDSAYGGSVWIGSEHGHSTLHGISTGYCFGRDGCFEEHRHSDPSGNPAGDVRGLAVCPDHSLWTGDAWWVARMPWGGEGATPDFWAVPVMGGYPLPLYDVFPGVDDSVYALSCDGRGTLWVASYGDGLAHIDPATSEVEYFSAADSLPQNLVTAVALTDDGAVWIGTAWAGLARLKDGRWTYYNSLSGLPSDTINALAVHGGTLYVAHDRGLAEVGH